MTTDDGIRRTFESGATRDTQADKLDYEGFFSARVWQAFAEYMHHHRYMKDGGLRDSDNWQKGIPLDVYMKSMFRHFMEVWQRHRGVQVRHPGGTMPGLDDAVSEMVEVLMGVLFNVQGYADVLLRDMEGLPLPAGVLHTPGDAPAQGDPPESPPPAPVEGSSVRGVPVYIYSGHVRGDRCSRCMAAVGVDYAVEGVGILCRSCFEEWRHGGGLR